MSKYFKVSIILVISIIFTIHLSAQSNPRDMEFVFVEGGGFWMGCPDGNDLDWKNDEINYYPHYEEVDDYYIGKYEVTNAQFATFLNEYGSNLVKEGKYKGEALFGFLDSYTGKHILPSEDGRSFRANWGLEKNWKGLFHKPSSAWEPKHGFETLPAVYISFHGAREFCKFYGYRLPNVIEWEYAARSRVTSERWSGTNDVNKISEYAFVYPEKYSIPGHPFWILIQPVGKKKPNRLGIYDMTGNVEEWCDPYTKHDIVRSRNLRNGSIKIVLCGFINGERGVIELSQNWCYSARNGDNGANGLPGFRCAKDK